MFKKIVTHPGFWKSVFSMALAFMVLFMVFKWVIEGFKWSFFKPENPIQFYGTLVAAGLVYGIMVTYGKFWKRFKEMDR